MCDYSLEHVASRPAKVGDKLVSTSFRGLTVGFCGLGEPNIAVCLLPGTELAFDREIELQSRFFWKRRKLGTDVGRFCRVNEGCRAVHHDALQLPSGQVILLTALNEGQLATVLQLPAVSYPQELVRLAATQEAVT